jgi:probable F420-dependent oxidoreductase
MKVDAELPFKASRKIAEAARTLEEIGFDGAAAIETGHDPFLTLMLAAEHSTRLELHTAIAVAFARSPMTLASTAYDLNGFALGRFTLGLGSQIKAHIEKRFSMPYSHPAARMREFIEALHAIWANWQEGTRLEFRGQFYNHTLMTPMFTPERHEFGPPKVLVAAVGPLMTEVAVEVGDGVLIHPLTSERYLREVTLPIVEKSLAKVGKTRADVQLAYPVFVVSGDTEETFVKTMRATRERIAFYGSTPAYRGVLDLHGWGDLQPELNLLSKQGRWKEMGDLIDDSMLDAFAVVAEPDQVAAKLRQRYTGLVDRVAVGFNFVARDKRKDLVRALQAA